MIYVIQEPKEGAVFLSENSLLIKVKSTLGKDYFFKVFIKVDNKEFDVQGWGKYTDSHCIINLQGMFNNLFTFDFSEVTKTSLKKQKHLIKRIDIVVKEYKREDETEVNSQTIPHFFVLHFQQKMTFDATVNLQKLSVLPNTMRLTKTAVFSLPIWVNTASVSVRILSGATQLYSKLHNNLEKGVYNFSFKLSDFVTNQSEIRVEVQSGTKVFTQKILIQDLYLYSVSKLYFKNIFGVFEYVELFGSKKSTDNYKRKKFSLPNQTAFVADIDTERKHKINTGFMLPNETVITRAINESEEIYYFSENGIVPAIPTSKKSKQADTGLDYLDDYIEIQENGLPNLNNEPDNYINREDIVFDADFMVLTYNFTDGRDLDTRTRIVTPDIGQNSQPNYIGWGVQSAFPATDKLIVFGGDNQGTGLESVLVNIKKLREKYPNATELVVDSRAFWYRTVGVQPVNLKASFYKGGAMVKNGYSWTNPTAITKLEFDTQGKIVPGPKITKRTTSGHRVATFTYNLDTRTGSFSIIDQTTPSV